MATGNKMAEMVQMIVGLQDMQTRQKAQQLAQQMAPYQQAQLQAATLGGLQGVGQGMVHPADLAALAPTLAPGALDPNVLRTMFGGTAPAAATTQGAALAQGFQANPTQLSTDAAQHFLGAPTEDQRALQHLNYTLFQHADNYLGGLDPNEATDVSRQVLSRVATGQHPGEAAMDLALADLPPEQLTRAAQIGKDLIPGATPQEQLRQGMQHLKIEEYTAISNSASQGIQARAALMHAQAAQVAGGAKTLQEADVMLQHRDALLQSLQQHSATLTGPGGQLMATQINAYNERLRQMMPETYGPKGAVPLQDLDLNGTVGTTSPTQAVLQSITGKH